METHSLESGLVALAAYAIVILSNDRISSGFISPDIARYLRILEPQPTTLSEKINWWCAWIFAGVLYWIMLWGISFLAAMCAYVTINSELFTMFIKTNGWLSPMLRGAVLIALAFIIITPHLDKALTLSKNIKKDRPYMFSSCSGFYSSSLIILFLKVSTPSLLYFLLTSFTLIASATINMSTKTERILFNILVLAFVSTFLFQFVVPQLLE